MFRNLFLFCFIFQNYFVSFNFQKQQKILYQLPTNQPTYLPYYHNLYSTHPLTCYSGYINQSLEVDEYFPALYDDFDYKTDVFDDDEEEEELKFSDTESDEEDIFSDEYLDDDDGIVIDVSETTSMNSTSMETAATNNNSLHSSDTYTQLNNSNNNKNEVILNTSSVC